MRTTLDLDDALMDALLMRLPGRTKTDALEEALRSYLQTDAVAGLLELAGTMDIEDLAPELRAHDRTT